MKFPVVINPTSGKGKSKEIFEKYLKSHLVDNNIELDIFVSEKKGSIEETVSKYDFGENKNILLIGGDGSLFEIFQGLKDNDTENFKIYLTSTGSGNGIYTSFNKPQFKNCKIINDNILKLSNFEIGNKKGLFGLGISIGIISDVDLNTEWMRFIGNTRYDLGGIYYILNTPSYKLKINYTDDNNNNSVLEDSFLQVFVFKCSHCSDTMLLNKNQKASADNYTLIAIPSTLTKFELIKLFMNLSEDYSPYYDNEKIIIKKIKNFKITPLDDLSYNSLTIDGESFKFNSPLEGSISNKKIYIS